MLPKVPLPFDRVKSRLSNVIPLPPEELRVADLIGDLTRLARSVAYKYEDMSCYALSPEDIVSECLARVPVFIEKGYLRRPRGEFFRIAKASFNNRVTSLVSRHRFTKKRGFATDEEGRQIKPEVSYDDPDSHIQIKDTVAHDTTENDTFVADVRTALLPVEKLVFDALTSPASAAYASAYVEASRGRAIGEPLHITISSQDHADALGISVNEFEKVRKRIADKIKAMANEDTDYTTALSHLETTFDVQVPRNTDKTIVSRLFTLAARDNYTKVTPKVEAWLKVVKARIPVFNGERLTCYGVLFEKGHRICAHCSLRDACATECANYGLGEIVISPKLIQQARTPVHTDNVEASVAHESGKKEISSDLVVHPVTARDERLLAWIDDKLTRVHFVGEVYYRFPGPTVRSVFCIGKAGKLMKLRLCKPSPELVEEYGLEKDGRSYYLPDSYDFDKAKELLEKHTDNAFAEISR